MKYLILLLPLTFPFTSQAGILETLLFASVISSKNKGPEPVKTELEIQINTIKNTLPSLCHPETSIYYSCWSRFREQQKVYSVSDKLGKELHSYFTNLGYATTLSSSSLTFNFEPQHKKFLLHKKTPISIDSVIALLAISIFPFTFFLFFLSYKKKVLKIKSLYYENESSLLFFSKPDKAQLEKSLASNKFPPHWHFHTNEKEILRITYSSKGGAGIIAIKKEIFNKTLSSLNLNINDN